MEHDYLSRRRLTLMKMYQQKKLSVFSKKQDAAGRGVMLEGTYHKGIVKEAAKTHLLFEAKIAADMERALNNLSSRQERE